MRLIFRLNTTENGIKQLDSEVIEKSVSFFEDTRSDQLSNIIIGTLIKTFSERDLHLID
jgi:hypothetical protein